MPSSAGDRLVIRPLWTRVHRRSYLRRVLPVPEPSGRPIGMGSIRLSLDAFSSRVGSRIVSGEAPLGRILREAQVPFRIQPARFLAVTPNAEMMGVFWMRTPETLYARQTLVSLKGATIGHVVDVLALV